MPLNTKIVRDGKTLPVRWGEFHVAAMIVAATFDSGEGQLYDLFEQADNLPARLRDEQGRITIGRADAWHLVTYDVIGASPLNSGDYTLTESWAFLDPSDGEVFELKPGDVLSAWRSH